jgi:hypothetical protein
MREDKRTKFRGTNNIRLEESRATVIMVFAGVVVAQTPGGDLLHFDRIGYIFIATTLLSLVLMYFIQRAVAKPFRR